MNVVDDTTCVIKWCYFITYWQSMILDIAVTRNTKHRVMKVKTRWSPVLITSRLIG